MNCSGGLVLRVVFMGTPGFAVPSLERLYSDGHDVAGVFTQPDKARNRGMKLSFSPVKEAAATHGTPVYQPSTLRGGEAAEMLRVLGCDIAVVVAYGKILPKEVLEIPPLGCVNVHGSLLPKYRGAAPIQWAVMNGEKETGVTSQYMGEEVDAGDILLSDKVQVGDDETAGELYERLSVLGAEVLSDTLKAISSGTAVRVPQDHSLASPAPMLSSGIRLIDWTETAHKIKCRVRGLNPKPSAVMDIGGVALKVFKAEPGDVITDGRSPGDMVYSGKHGIIVACADRDLVISEVQPPGGRRMPAADYVRGRKLGLVL